MKRLLWLVPLLVLGCDPAFTPQPHHWVKVQGKQASPYDTRYFWVDDSAGRSDCEIRQESAGFWSVYVRGQGYGDFQTLPEAQTQCYSMFHILTR